jgi:p-hydroxybenzoate 3-monooxygenase
MTAPQNHAPQNHAPENHAPGIRGRENPAPDSRLRATVGIIGAGPAGLLLAHLLARRGVDSIVLERQNRQHISSRIRAGVLEQSSVEVLRDVGLGARLDREGLRHGGIHLQFDGARHRVSFEDAVGRSVWIYGQHEVVADLLASHDALGTPIVYNVGNVTLHGLESSAPSVRFDVAGGDVRRELSCDVVVGADGFHGVSRRAIPALESFGRDYPYAWLGVLARVAPSTDELIYCLHQRGFAMHSMRSPEVSRLYLQVDPDDSVEAWPDDRIWAELDTRLATPGWALARGTITDKAITPMRAFAVSTMHHGRLALAGDAAHIVPPTGAKGLNLAIADVWRLDRALARFFEDGDFAHLQRYSREALRRMWQVQYFSNWMTRMLHTSRRVQDEQPAASEPDRAGFDYHMQLGQLHNLVETPPAIAQLATFYTGMPLLG